MQKKLIVQDKYYVYILFVTELSLHSCSKPSYNKSNWETLSLIIYLTITSLPTWQEVLIQEEYDSERQN